MPSDSSSFNNPNAGRITVPEDDVSVDGEKKAMKFSSFDTYRDENSMPTFMSDPKRYTNELEDDLEGMDTLE